MANDRLQTEFAGLNLRNPTMLAAGILGYSTDTFQTIVKAGAAAIVTKSIGAKPRTGYANPTVVQVGCGLLNAMGLPNPGINEFTEEIRKAKAEIKVPIIVSVYGFSAKEYALVSGKAAEAGADAVELNVSCPHVKETGSEICQNPETLSTVIKRVKAEVDEPIIVKLSPNVADIAALAKTAERAGADALTAVNTYRAMAIDTETMRPILSNRTGGLSGSSVKPMALRCVYEIYEAVDIPVIGCGGIANWRDAVEFLLAGACAVQIGTAIAYEGVGVFRSVSRGLDTYLRKKSFRSVKDIVGRSHTR